MDREMETMAPRRAEVLMLVPEVVRQIRQLRELGWGIKRIAGQTGVARGTVRRYLRGGIGAETQRRPGAWTLEEKAQVLAAELLDGAAEGNAVVSTVTMSDAELAADPRFKDVMRTATTSDICREIAPARQSYIDAGLSIAKVYKDAKGSQILRVDVSPADCG